jgi:hypothetical protein
LRSDTVPMLLVPDFAALLLIAYWIWDSSSRRGEDSRARRGRRRRCGGPWFKKHRRHLHHHNEMNEDLLGSSPDDERRRFWWPFRNRETRRDDEPSLRPSITTPIPLQPSQQAQRDHSLNSITSTTVTEGERYDQQEIMVTRQNQHLIRDNVYHTLCRVVSSIFLVALTIYQPVLYMVQLQDQLYQDQITQDCSSSSSGRSSADGGNYVQADHFCLLFRTRILLTFVWAFLVLAELAVAYAAGELCSGEDDEQHDNLPISSEAGSSPTV